MRKANQFRKQNWSAPTIMTVFIIVCMIVIYSMESLGLANKEKNLEFRYTTPEKIIRTVSEATQTRGPLESSEDDIMLIQQLRVSSERSKDDHLEQMMRILIDGANYQYGYQNKVEENEFYDI